MSEKLDRLTEAAEDLVDIRAAAAAREEMAETGETPIPWEQVKADLGLPARSGGSDGCPEG